METHREQEERFEVAFPKNGIPAALQRGVSSLVTARHNSADSLVWPCTLVGRGSKSRSCVSGPMAAWCSQDPTYTWDSPGQTPPTPPARREAFGSI